VDLQRFFTADLATLWASRRWRKLLNFIEHIPVNSAFTQAYANDTDAARAQLEREGVLESLEERHERWIDWSPERQGLARIEDRVQELTRVVASALKAKPGPFRPAPRPHSALEEMRSNRRKAQHAVLVARVVRRE
jgi:hypothetical protein